MAGTTSLLKSAASTRKKVQQQEDAVVAFNWQNSAQTYEDFLNYSKYLEDRQASAADSSQALSYAKTIISARRSYTSNEIQRQQIAVMEGRATTSDKMKTVYDLYNQAVENQDYNLAQNLVSQYDSLSIKLQNEAEAAQKVAGTLAMNSVKTLDQLIKKATTGNDFIELPDGTVIKPLAQLSDELKANGQTGADYFGESLKTVQAMQDLIVNAYNGAQTQEVVDAIESKYGDYITGEKTFKTAAGNLSVNDIELAYRSALANNPLYSPQEVRNEATGALEYKLQKNKIDNFIWIRNEDGTYQAVQEQTKVPSSLQTLDAKITNEGYFVGQTDKNGVGVIGTGEKVKTDTTASIKDRLQAQGIVASQNADGSLDLVLPSGEQVKGAIQADGSVRYFGRPSDYSGGQAGLYEINIFNGEQRAVAPDEASIFGQASQFGGQISKASDAGIKTIQALAGITKSPTDVIKNAQITNFANDFTGNGVPVLGRNLQGTSGILQTANTVRDLQAQKTAADQLQAQEQQRLQQATVFNLNQTPVQQFASNGAPIRQLTVARPAPIPTVRVAAPAPTPVISNVSVAPTTQRIGSVSVAPAQPRVVVR